MDNLDDSENAKISDSAYSNSCSNSQSRRSHSSKSTNSGSSGSSGYGGDPSTSAYSNKKKKQPKNRLKKKEKNKSQIKSLKNEMIPDDVHEIQTEMVTSQPVKEFELPQEEEMNDSSVRESTGKSIKAREGKVKSVALMSPSSGSHAEKGVASMEICTSDRTSYKEEESFSSVISLHDGIVMCATTSITNILGYPKDMWIGKSFLNFVHEKDRKIFSSHIKNGFIVPRNAFSMYPNAAHQFMMSNVVCRLRRYRGLATGFGVRERVVNFKPFLLKFSFKDITELDEDTTYLIVRASPFISAFKIPYQVISNAVPFVIRHTASGSMEYVDPEAVSYLGYVPHDLQEKNALQLYHPHDMDYLQRVYETTVREGSVPRGSPYRMLIQNGCYIKLETEWSCFINPWSKKLECVIAKHHVVEGPKNPDVFQTADHNSTVKFNVEDRVRSQRIRENIVRMMNEVLTKPAKIAKHQLSKRCKDLAAFMETLMEETPKPEDNPSQDIHEADRHSYYGSLGTFASCLTPTGIIEERDSVMLGGLSPHHDYSDSKSSSDTPISYTQLNYNDTLQRFFDRHQPYNCEEMNSMNDNKTYGITDPMAATGHCMFPLPLNSGDFGDGRSASSHNIAVPGSSSQGNMGYIPIRLTESLLKKHNNEMEKQLVRMHRETRSNSRSERDRQLIENRQKKKEHLARCNATYQPTSAGLFPSSSEGHGIKRASKTFDSETEAHKHHCPSPREPVPWESAESSIFNSTSVAANTVASPWPTPCSDPMNPYILGMGVPQPISFVNPVTAVPGVFPMYYTPPVYTTVAPGQAAVTTQLTNTPYTCNQPPMPSMMYGEGVYGTPVVYAPPPSQMTYGMQQNYFNQSHFDVNPDLLSRRTYQMLTKPPVPLKPKILSRRSSRDIRRSKPSKSTLLQLPNFHRDGSSPSNSYNRSSEPVTENNMPCKSLNNEDVVDRTDGESSYYSYSSFFKTDSGSAEDSDNKKSGTKPVGKFYSWSRHSQSDERYGQRKHLKDVPKRSKDPPWMDQVCLTTDLIYKYKVVTKTLQEVLSGDNERMKTMEQSAMVNEQLSQLYMDLHLEGENTKLILDEGITSSSSSDEDSVAKNKKNKQSSTNKNSEFSRLVMIYEEDAPLPPPSDNGGLLAPCPPSMFS